MYFTKNISTFLVSALLATSAVGELTQVRRADDGGVARAEADNAIREATYQEVRKRGDDCLSAIKRRRALSARASKFVDVNAWAHGRGTDTLTTNGLATCYGVAITGNYDGGHSGYDRWLVHALEAERDPAEKMFDEVEAARNHGLNNLYALLVYPEPSSFGHGFTDEDREDIKAEHDWYVEWITDATGGVAPEEKGHHYEESWGMKIGSGKAVQAGNFVG
ncbi:hypothetical protein F4801DRAFT_599276 [Xylaria longipes]|nr:hypothetical protein F4801DRAFT_599276 [Xylaria longipes]RYC57675.1 hypothetical protein CHU98_g8530 [Xylaria longipes]